jgi:hypothetical protein
MFLCLLGFFYRAPNVPLASFMTLFEHAVSKTGLRRGLINGRFQRGFSSDREVRLVWRIFILLAFFSCFRRGLRGFCVISSLAILSLVVFFATFSVWFQKISQYGYIVRPAGHLIAFSVGVRRKFWWMASS